MNNNQVWYTSRFSSLTYKKSILEVYAICLEWPTLLESYNDLNSTITLNSTILCSSINAFEFLGYNSKLKYKKKSANDFNESQLNQVDYFCSEEDPYFIYVDVKQLNPVYSLSKWAWIFKIYLII